VNELSSQQLSGFRSGRSPYSVVPEPPTLSSLVPHQVGAGRPWRWSRRRWRPGRRRTPGTVARGRRRASRTLPVVAVIPVPVRDGAPAWVPLITGAPVRAGRRPRLGPGAGAAGQSESGRRQPKTHQHTRRSPSPKSFPSPGSRQVVDQPGIPTPPVAPAAAPKLATLCDRSAGSRA
jgi:hypothetical protein